MSGTTDLHAQFVALMAAYATPIRRLCGAYTASAQDRDDLFQEIFLAVGAPCLAIAVTRARARGCIGLRTTSR